MLKNILTVLRKLASAAMNFLIVYFETIAVPMSWAMGGTIMFTMYTELSNIFNGAVCLLVGLWQLGCTFTGRELPLWLKRLKFISTSCLAMTLLTVVIILAPMYEDGNGWYIMLFTGSMLYHHFLNPVLAILSLVLFERLPRLPLGPGRVEAPIARRGDSIIGRCVCADGKYSLTEYAVLAAGPGHSLLACWPRTGRTHQIRVHMASTGHPLAGDAVYGPKNCIKSLNGQCLHAKELGFVHPATGEWMQFDSSLPDWFQDYLSRLRKESRHGAFE